MEHACESVRCVLRSFFFSKCKILIIASQHLSCRVCSSFILLFCAVLFFMRSVPFIGEYFTCLNRKKSLRFVTKPT